MSFIKKIAAFFGLAAMAQQEQKFAVSNPRKSFKKEPLLQRKKRLLRQYYENKGLKSFHFPDDNGKQLTIYALNRENAARKIAIWQRDHNAVPTW